MNSTVFDGRPLTDIALEDIQSLVDDRVPEGQRLEYKESPHGTTSHDRREMLRDITALANSEGGYLVIGIREDHTGRAAALCPFADAHVIAQSVRQACLDGISERIDGLEVRHYETRFGQGIVAVRVPRGARCPHMVALEKRTEFYRRYDCEKRAMTVGEIRQLILSNAGLYGASELDLQKAGPGFAEAGASVGTTRRDMWILTDRPVQRFVQRYLAGGVAAHALVIVSPFIGGVEGPPIEVTDLLRKAMADRARVYVVTREPHAGYQQEGVAALEQCPLVEIRYNPDIHAKLYVVWSREEAESFALFGSGNLTESGLHHNIELGIMIMARGQGRAIVRELYQWSAVALRSMSERVKAITSN